MVMEVSLREFFDYCLPQLERKVHSQGKFGLPPLHLTSIFFFSPGHWNGGSIETAQSLYLVGTPPATRGHWRELQVTFRGIRVCWTLESYMGMWDVGLPTWMRVLAFGKAVDTVSSRTTARSAAH